MVALTLAMDRRMPRLAALKGQERRLERSHAGLVEARRDLPQRHRPAVLEQRDQEQREGVGLTVILDGLEAGHRDAELLAPGVWRHGASVAEPEGETDVAAQGVRRDRILRRGTTSDGDALVGSSADARLDAGWSSGDAINRGRESCSGWVRRAG